MIGCLSVPELLAAMHGDDMLPEQLLHGERLPALVAQELRDVQVLHHVIFQPCLRP